MELFTFGHPCEHQLRRACIGGTSCPLHGYPDHWCCSNVKGRINFKRDKPCEGPRCRWGFAHPPASSFDAVTQVLTEGRACAAKMEEAFGTGAMHGGPYVITSTHVGDVAHCALNMLRVPAARIAPRVGGLLAFAAVKAGEAKLFTQLLKTVKKPVDDYLIGAFEFLQAVAGGTSGGSAKGGAAKAAVSNKGDAGVLDDLRHDVTSIMGSALCSQGQLIARTEQLPLQSYYIAALKTATRGKKKFAEALEHASSLYGDAVERGPVAPECWVKGGRKGSCASSMTEHDAGEHSGASSSTMRTPEVKATTPATPPTATAASKGPPTLPSSSAKTTETTPVQPPAKPSPAASAAAPQPISTTNTSSKGSRALPVPASMARSNNNNNNSQSPVASNSGASSSSVPGASSNGPPPPPTTTVTLLEACQLVPMPEAEVRRMTSEFQPPHQSLPPADVFGGLFYLDLPSSAGSSRSEEASSSAPLGPAVRPAHRGCIEALGNPYRVRQASLATDGAARNDVLVEAALKEAIVALTIDEASA